MGKKKKNFLYFTKKKNKRHGYHHLFPHDPRRIVISPMISCIAIVPTSLLFLLFGNVGLNLMLGLIFGHLFIETTHYSLHYPTIITKFLTPLKHHHMAHHYKNVN